MAMTVAMTLLLAIGGLPATTESAHAADAKALAAQVQIRRTQYGVPHIQGETLEAAAFGFGYCQAEDHLINIMRGILETRGTLSQSLGPGENNKQLEADFFSRHYRIHQRAVANYHKLDPDYRAMIEGFAAGLNNYVDRHRASVPEWTPTVTGHDVAAYGLAGVMRFAFNRNNILKDFLKSQGVAATTVDTAVLDAESESAEVGSNMWAFAPSRSQSGRALLMGNPHQPWAPVSTYYEAHMTVPGKLNFYGSTFIGRPILTSGWNEHLGWSHTVNGPDLDEIYELDIDPTAANHYLFDGGSVPLEREDVTLQIKQAGGDTKSQSENRLGEGDSPILLPGQHRKIGTVPDNSRIGSKPETRTFWHTPLGPVVHRNETKVYVLRSACYENYRAYEQWLRMTQTKNFAEFRQAVAMNQVPMFNICYADHVGNIFYLWNGTVPNLPHPANKATAQHAARSSEIWTAFHKTDELPQLVNPPGGYVQNCNSPPFFTNLHAPIDPAKFPPHMQTNDVSLRTQHSLRLIHNDRKFTLEEVCNLKHSPLMLLGERVKADLIALIRASQPTSELESAAKALEDWDNTVKVESRGGTLFANWWQRYSEKDKRPNLFAVRWSAAEPTATPRGLAEPERALKMFLEALADVNSSFGRADVAWGEAHRIRKGAVDLPVSGGPGTMGCFRVLDYRKAGDGKLVANTGDSFVFAVEFSQPPKAYSVLAYSQSDVEGAPHFSDQAALFAAGKMKRVAFTDAEIQAQLIKSYRPGEE
jgi:acyl-homoserine-lactone acylase